MPADDRVGRLLAAIQEREETAREAEQMGLGGQWFSVVAAGSGDASVESVKALVVPRGNWIEFNRHIALNDPDAVLRLCQAHRKIIDLHKPSEWLYYDPETGEDEERLYCPKCAVGESCTCCLDSEDRVWPCETLLILAEGYGVEATP